MNFSKVFIFSSFRARMPTRTWITKRYPCSHDKIAPRHKNKNKTQKAQKALRQERLLGFFAIYSYPLTDPEVTPST